MFFMLTLRQIWLFWADVWQGVLFLLAIGEKLWNLLNDKMNIRNLVRHSFLLTKWRKPPLLLAWKVFVLLYLLFFLWPVNMSFTCFFFLVVIGRGEQVFLTINPTTLMRWYCFLRFFWHLCGLSYSYRTFFSLCDIWVVKSLGWL